MFDEILIPTDGSDAADLAVSYATDLASRYDATVHVLCVVDARILNNAGHREQLRDEQVELAEGTCNRVSDADVSVSQEVRTDVPHEAILSYASDADIDLVVMGSHGRTGMRRFVLGSVTEKVVRLSDVPVLTVTGDGDEVTYPYTDILVPTDGSQGADVAVEYAIDLARSFDARVHALSVVDTMAVGPDVRSEAVLDALDASAREAVASIEERATESSISDVETAVDHGSPHQIITSYVTDHGVDLVVMGTHGRSGIERYLLGSVTEKTVRTSPVPVLTVRQPESGSHDRGE